MRDACIRFLLLCVCANCAWSGESVEDTLALGRKALSNDGVTTAWKISQKALAASPDSAAAHEFAGEVLFRRGEFERSQAEFQQAVKIDPKYARAWWGLARIASCTSMDKTADELYRRAHEFDPRDPRLLF